MKDGKSSILYVFYAPWISEPATKVQNSLKSFYTKTIFNFLTSSRQNKTILSVSGKWESKIEYLVHYIPQSHFYCRTDLFRYNSNA